MLRDQCHYCPVLLAVESSAITAAGMPPRDARRRGSMITPQMEVGIAPFRQEDQCSPDEIPPGAGRCGSKWSRSGICRIAQDGAIS